MNVKVFERPVHLHTKKAKFAPVLTIPNGVTDVSFYEKAFGAFELRRFVNDDGSVHVSEFILDSDTLFHLHESTNKAEQSPSSAGTTTVIIGLFVDDVDAVMEKAKAAGAVISSPAQDYDYGYRQGNVVDPFGHNWQIQKAI